MERAEPGPQGGEPSAAERVWTRRLLALALISACLRLLFLGRWSLWLDEAYTFADSHYAWELNNPLGYALFGAFYRLFDARPGEMVLRFPGVFFGVLSIALAATALRVWLSPLGAAFAALALALSPWHLYWSQNARFYTLAQVLGLAGGALVFAGLVRAHIGRLLAGLVLAGLAALVHPSAVFLLGACLFTPLAFGRPELVPSPARSWGAADPVAARSVWWTHARLTLVALLAGSLWFADVWATWERRQGRGDPLHFLLTTGYLVTPALGAAALLGALWSLRERDRKAKFLALFVAAGFAAALGTSFLLRVSAQYVFVFLPFVAGLAGLAFEGVFRRSRGRALALSLLVLAPLSIESGLYFAVRHGDRPRWKEAYRYVFDRREPRDLVLGMDAPVAEYYWSPRSVDLRHWREVVQLDSYRARAAEEWLRMRRPMWLVVNLEQLEDWAAADRHDLRRFLEEDCRIETRFPVPLTPRDLDVLVYRYEPDAEPRDPR
jgi:mannosyltransferase